MNVTKLTISQETREKLNNPVLTPMKKRQLREQLMIERIRKARGDGLTKQQIVVAGGYSPDATSTNYALGIQHISSMIQRSVISHNPTKQFKKYWTVLADVKVTPSPKQVAESVIPATVYQEPLVEPVEAKVLNTIELQAMAKEFAWQNNSDSLRDFISYARNVIK